MADKHTPEPWKADAGIQLFGKEHHCVTAKTPYNEIAVALTGICNESDSKTSAANARRIAACVNAMAGYSTEQIEAFGQKALERLTAAETHRNAAMKVLMRCAEYLECIPESAAGGDDEAGKLARDARTVIRNAEAA